MCSCNAVVTGKELGAARWRREHRSGERQRPAKLPHDGRVAGMRRTHRDAAGPHRTAQPTQCSKRTATQRFRQMQDGLRAPCFFSSRVEHARTSPPPRRRRAELQGQNRRWLAASRLCSPSCERKHIRWTDTRSHAPQLAGGESDLHQTSFQPEEETARAEL